MHTHGFTEDDLVLNQAGRLSASQRRSLLFLALRRMALAVALIGVAVLLNQAPDSLPARVICGLAALGLWAGAAQLVAAIQSARPVTALVGPLSIEAGRVFHPVGYRVKGRSLVLSATMLQRQAYGSIVPGQLYRVYLLRRTDRVVSLEPVEREEEC